MTGAKQLKKLYFTVINIPQTNKKEKRKEKQIQHVMQQQKNEKNGEMKTENESVKWAELYVKLHSAKSVSQF